MSHTPRPEILNFNLFGESGDLPDVVHCETIETRSTLHDWEFAPHRHASLHQILLVQSGAGTALLDGLRHNLSPRSAVNVPLGLVHGFSFQPGTHGLVVTFSAEMLDQGLRPEEGLRQVLSHGAVFCADTDTQRTMIEIATAFAGREFARAQILRAFAGVLLGQVARAITRTMPRESTAEPATLTRFLRLVDLHYPDHWTVARYAQELAISPTHLSRLTREATGRPASGLIEERLIREARRNLVYTNLPVSRIAYALGFEDPAYFTRVFTRATGLSPRAFRQRLFDETR
jgi:AraC family transcriptional activator of pobA